MKKMKILWLLTLIAVLSACKERQAQETEQQQSPKLKALIVDGQNNHYVWPKTTMMMKDYLEQTGLFEVDIQRDDTVWLGIKYQDWRSGTIEKYITEYPLDSSAYFISYEPVKTSAITIDFSNYDVIISNLGENTPEWSGETKGALEEYMQNGGGLIVVHAANNAWGNWEEFNKMIGLGAWGGRDSTSGPYVYYNDAGEIEIDPSEGQCATHGLEHEFVITSREPDHPIMKGLPTEWLHAQDEMYDRMRGPFENATILATAYSDAEENKQPWEPVLDGTGWNVPMLMAVNYGKGRVFHTTLGHFDYSMECVGFIITLQRGAEWVATGEVTQEIPTDFPSKEKSISRAWKKE
ncbi:ThuA domain-containing protein [Flammeovirgaceae bacterium SG7u.111]|nr:ThuA domain-containing protein [Flammeovirgaceae bacterium SG7u.132]WPO36604.1 ThuA domain-containing protein [Flammeovirgaceae bacterium SG7u.111]